MRRKLIKQGQGGFTVTLPVNWVREYGLKGGEEVNVNEQENGVLISAQLAKREKTIALDVSNYDPRMILNLINQSYRLGYDVIKINYNTVEQEKTIQDITPSVLLGFEIVDRTDKKIILQNIAEPDPEKIEIIIRKIFLQILSISELVIQGLQENRSNLVELHKLKEQVDKYTNYTRRTIIRSKYGGERAALLYAIISQLSLICHAYVYLYEYVLKTKAPISKEIINHLMLATKMFKDYYSAFYKKDLNLLYQIGVAKIDLTAANNQLLEKKKGTENVIIAYVREIIRLVHFCTPFTIGYQL